MRAFFILSGLILIGCTDADISNLKSYGERAEVYCYSGGKEIFRAESTGKVVALGGGGWNFRTTDGKYVRTFADCFVEVLEQ